MPYGNFKTIEDIQARFPVAIDSGAPLFDSIEEISPGAQFAEMLKENVDLALNIDTEKARSEFIIAPLLMEIRRMLEKKISLFSGSEFNVDSDAGLNGYCDFIISKSPDQVFIRAPVICVVEAKNENIRAGFGQCIAEMLAARLFNERNAASFDYILGVVTTGSNWRFLKLEGDRISIDFNEYLISQVGKILGILTMAIKDNGAV
uniref:Type I restriction enzyme R protein N terminus (HSDR_N) n=1 Tax=Candidatus Kentrum eta TaxID=2126337 RepID=A0A450U9C8_9GAMM|nr:MAG: hypothetical protein BECKH772A_GA0070896_1000928 [Candidatus Kentron sp. H]VFJ90608.1 MAG: hypothetical protein BECKH772B_GA0070898_1001028 [Candidatus Kentron sp. H]VFJ96759.1 MAG: hypothetical protein BECKH772C_GA0070978_1000828 [Candidatus Kentron sp. H]